MQAWGSVRAFAEPTRRPEWQIVHPAIGAPDSGAPFALALIGDDYFPSIAQERDLAISKARDIPLYLALVYALQAEQVGFGICFIAQARLMR
jgi:hypothetical protein